MLQHKHVEKHFWAEELLTTTNVRIWVTSLAFPRNKNPHHLWKVHAPTLSHGRAFGSKCWYLALAKAREALYNKS